MVRFVFIGTGKDYVKSVWQSIITRKDVEWVDTPYILNNTFKSTLCHAHSSFLLNRYFNLPFREIWYNSCALEKIDIIETDKYYIVLFDNALARYTPDYIEKFKKKYKNVYFILYMDNAMHKKERIIKTHLKNIDIVYTNNKYDADKYGFNYCFNIIPSISTDNISNDDYDVFFIGNAYDRLDIIHAVYDKLEDLGLRVKMYVNGAKVSSKDKRKNIVYNKKLPYHEVVEYYNRSMCLLEVVGEKPTMLTMRMMEAVARNKKLITNHPFIKEQEFFDERFILFFEKPEDITIDFFKNNTDVRYNYTKDFSPDAFLKRILNDLQRNTGI